MLAFLLANTERWGVFGCLVWMGCRDKDGYGQVKYQKRLWRVHRLVYALSVGLTELTVVNHVRACSYASCILLAHLEVVTGTENARRRGEFSPPMLNRRCTSRRILGSFGRVSCLEAWSLGHRAQMCGRCTVLSQKGQNP